MVTAITVVCSLIRIGTRRCQFCCTCNVLLAVGESKVCFLNKTVRVVISAGMHLPQSCEREGIEEIGEIEEEADNFNLFWMYLTPCI